MLTNIFFFKKAVFTIYTKRGQEKKVIMGTQSKNWGLVKPYSSGLPLSGVVFNLHGLFAHFPQLFLVRIHNNIHSSLPRTTST